MDNPTIINLDEDGSSIYVNLHTYRDEPADDVFALILAEPGGWVLEAIKKRFYAYKLDVDQKVMIMIMSLGDCAIGKCVKYVDHIAMWCKENHQSKIDWDIFTKQIYTFNPYFEKG